MSRFKLILTGIGFAFLERLLGNLLGLVIGIFFGISAGIYAVSHGVSVESVIKSEYFPVLIGLSTLPFELMLMLYLLKKFGKHFHKTIFTSLYSTLGVFAWIAVLTSHPQYSLVPLVAIMGICYYIEPKYILKPKTKKGA